MASCHSRINPSEDENISILHFWCHAMPWFIISISLNRLWISAYISICSDQMTTELRIEIKVDVLGNGRARSQRKSTTVHALDGHFLQSVGFHRGKLADGSWTLTRWHNTIPVDARMFCVCYRGCYDLFGTALCSTYSGRVMVVYCVEMQHRCHDSPGSNDTASTAGIRWIKER